jgi:hypothetical protein
MTHDLAIWSGAHSLGPSLENGVAGVIGVAAKSATSGNAWKYASYARYASETAEAERMGLTLKVERDQCLPISGLKGETEYRESCRKCNGRGRFVGWSGRTLGNCFA